MKIQNKGNNPRLLPSLSQFAERLEISASWEDLTLPEAELQRLREIASSMKHRATLAESADPSAKIPQGSGVVALFAGPSGPNKTQAAAVLANELKLPLYRIDLSSVVSNYIGETEKNLGRVFDAVKEGGVILFFDEADALFGKRSEVKDSHDRYANIEVNYLLQRMEAYPGIVILTTNRKCELDHAFLHRNHIVIEFQV
jgi:SpoVK/Ycf46/Vps4 family AAA+-type ATPase